MSTIQRIAKNAGVLLASHLVSKILRLLCLMYIARYLGAEGFGILCFAVAFTGIFGVFTDVGLGPLTVREVARNKSLAPKYLANVSTMKMILAVFTFGLIALTINLLGYPRRTIDVVYLIALCVIFGAFTQMFYSIFQAFEKMEYQSVGQILNGVLMLAGVIFAMKYSFSVVGFACLYVIASITVLGYSFAVAKLRFWNPALGSPVKAMEFNWNFWKPAIKKALPFGLTGMFGMMYTYIDSVMLSLMKGNEVVGWYNGAYRLILVLLFIPGIIGVAVFPSMSRFYISSQSSLRLMCAKYFKVMLIIGFPVGVATTLLANKIILLIFGGGYQPSIIALQILVWTMVLTFAGAAFVKLFESINRQAVIAKLSGLCLVANVMLNLLLIPKFSYVGASVATVITEFILVGGIFFLAYKIGYGIQGKEFMETILKVIVAGLIMGTFIWYFKSLNLLMLVVLSILLYFGVLYTIGGIDKEDVALFREAIKLKKVLKCSQ